MLYIPENKDLELIKTESTIIWIEEDGGSYMVGAAFNKFAPGDLKRFRRWLLNCIKAQKEGRSYI